MILIIWTHPSPDSLTASLAQSVMSYLLTLTDEVQAIDLYRIHADNFFPPVIGGPELHRKTSFDPIVQKQMALVENAEGYVVIHPDWWGGPPALLKGWIDRVLRPGTAYEIPEGFGYREARGLLSGRRAAVIVSGDADDAGPLEEFWVKRIWGFCGADSRLFYLSRIRERGRSELSEMIEGISTRTVDFLMNCL